MTSWTADFVWPGTPDDARKRISEWTGTLEPSELRFEIDGTGQATATVQVEAATLLDAFELTRQIIDEFLGPETLMERLRQPSPM